MGVPGSSFTDIDSGTSEVIAEALIMLEKPAKFEFAHRLLGGALHGGLGALNNDRSIIGFLANSGRRLRFKHSERADFGLKGAGRSLWLV